VVGDGATSWRHNPKFNQRHPTGRDRLQNRSRSIRKELGRIEYQGATYQRAMNLIFHDLLGVMVEVYIDDIVIKSVGFKEHVADLRVSLERMRKYGLQMNPLKCAFDVAAG
jgi:hypothetical protein